jgi:thioredoxin domain-containing protein 5
MAPAWRELAYETSGKFKIAEVNAELNADLISKFKVNGYPTLILFKDGEKVTEYLSGNRKVEDLREYLDYVTTPKKNDGEILELDENNFEIETSLFSTQTFVKFYSPNCGYCKQVAPIWKELAKKLEGTSVRIAKIDCTLHKAPCERFEIEGYPTMLFLTEGNYMRYGKGRTLEDFEKFSTSGWKLKKKLLKPEIRSGFQFSWKFFLIAVVLASVLCIACVILIFYLTDEDDDEVKLRKEYKKYKQNLAAEKTDKND